MSNRAGNLTWGVLLSVFSYGLYAADRQIEEIVVTAEKVESTVSDTSISITAFSEEAIEEFGLQGADELVNYLPATTRDAYDIRIRGVGRNFRALGGDPGVATYYNGVYSPDFGIAASENGLYDLQRIEVLRGPQGTLYGRNSIGGALNYVTNRPTFKTEGELRTQLGEFSTREFYGVFSGALIDDVLAARVVGVKRDRDGWIEGIGAAPDIDSIDDSNYALALLWQISENMELYIRGNERESDRDIGLNGVITEGPGSIRGRLSSNVPVFGLVPTVATDPAALAFTDPRDGSTRYGRYARPGLEPTLFPFQPNAAFGRADNASLLAIDPSNAEARASVNKGGTGKCEFPYVAADCNHEYFGHRAGSAEFTWDLNDNTTLAYIYGHNDFDYTFNIDNDYHNSDFTRYRQTVLEDVYSYSHELQLHWSLGENFTATSGAFAFKEQRDQNYNLNNDSPRFTQAATYGNLDSPIPGFLQGFLGLNPAVTPNITLMQFMGIQPAVRLGQAAPGTSISGRWGGSITPETSGDIYRHKNTVDNEQIAFYTQGTYKFNDQWQVVAGVRYAEDDKKATEIRGGYFEFSAGFANFIVPFQSNGLATGLANGCNPFLGCNISTLATSGLTSLGLQNIALGRATWSGNPANPLVPNCALTNATCTSTLMLGPGVPISYTSTVVGSDTWSDTNFRLNFDWTPNDDLLIYFGVTTGYRAGGYSLGVTDARDGARNPNGTPIVGSEIKPKSYDAETVTSYEIGYKGTLLDSKLQINAAVYLYDYEGYQDQLDFFDPVRNSTVDAVGNAPEATNMGFEVEALWLATDQLTLGGNYSLTETEYGQNYAAAINDDPNLPASLFGNATTAPALFRVNLEGNPLKRIPRHKSTVWGELAVPTFIGNIDLRGTYAFTGEYFSSAITREIDRVHARFQVDLSAGWTDSSDRWNVRLFVDNATDESSPRGIGTDGEGENWRQRAELLYPRYWGIDVVYSLFP